LIDPSKQFQENILRHILDVFPGSEEPADESEDHCGVLVHNGFVSRPVARLSANN
jgi:hypothetical protein